MAGPEFCAEEKPIALENSWALLQIDPTSGTFVRILDRSSGIELTPARSLAENFRLTLLTPDKKTFTILGKDQKLSKVNRMSGGVELRWDGPFKDTAGAEHQIDVRMNVKSADNCLQFGLHLDNRTSNKINEAWYPMIGGLTKFGAPGRHADPVVWIPKSDPVTKKVELPFGSVLGEYPGSANMSFTCVQSAAARKSLYFASHDEIARYKVHRFAELANGNDRDVFACVQHFPFTPPGKTFDGSTVVLRVVDGDWRAAGQVYRSWFEKTFGICKPSDCWIRRESFFQDTMFKLPEGTINYRFKDIPHWAKDAKDHGINSVMISGWHLGGHDNGYPHYVVDPDLGTWKELERGIKACHKMGVKVYFFVNYQPVMIDSDWYKNELVKYRDQNPDGNPYWIAGWGMGTLWARMGHPKLMVSADPAFPEYRKIIVDQFVRLAQIGGDGIHVDKMYPDPFDFNPDAPMSPDTASWEGAILLTKEVLGACRKYNPSWAMSFECNWDRVLQFGDATWWFGNQKITRAMFPEHVETVSIASAFDFLGVNTAVRDGNAVLVGPQNYTRSVGWKPWEGLADYIKVVKRIQDRLLDTVYLGEVVGRAGVRISGDGVHYNVFRNLSTQKRVCILTNPTMKPKRPQFAGFEPDQSPKVRVHVPFHRTKVVKLPSEIEVPAEGIVFVEEL